ncbi:MAG: 16S rRNA (cytosine(1402)-N(4))-methyltransferase RsmH [Phycisphaerae bacterium]|nr:16S rRNA (cytosine(1402)-N(4))-methyltransferase RsmH [Phycisphaerae bacterium]
MERFAAHIPVLRDEVVDLLDPAGGQLIVDCTVGCGGHAEALLAAGGPGVRLIGIDRDENGIRQAKCRLERFGDRVRLFAGNFADIGEVLSVAGEATADVVLADLGVASRQLDDPARGLSFATDGPLDMRLDRGQQTTAETLVNALGERELADLIYRNSNERYSRRIARAIVRSRRNGRIERTSELARIVSEAVPAPARRRRRGVHPATRTFQALRIAVNDELGSLETLLRMLPAVLASGARVAVISFHSLEDRRVKRAFREWADMGRAERLTKKPIVPGETEIQQNPRSRSAKLRGVRWIA